MSRPSNEPTPQFPLSDRNVNWLAGTFAANIPDERFGPDVDVKSARTGAAVALVALMDTRGGTDLLTGRCYKDPDPNSGLSLAREIASRLLEGIHPGSVVQVNLTVGPRE